MLTKVPQYNEITRKCIIAVGGLFSNVFTVTKDSGGVTKKIVNVPIAYADKEKFIVRLQQDPSLNEDVQISLPRLSFEIVGMEYDSSRQLNKINKVMADKNNQTVHYYSPVPYTLSINLYSYTKTQEDNYQIMEQIIPYFTPDMNLSIKMIKDPEIIQDCQFILNSVNTDSSYDGSFEDRRYIITTYSFMLKMNFFGPFYGINDPEKHFQDGPPTSIIKKVTINVNSNKYTAVVDPFEANKDDVHSIIESWGPRTGGPDDFDVGATV